MSESNKKIAEVMNDTTFIKVQEVDLLETQLSSTALKEWLENPAEDIYADE